MCFLNTRLPPLPVRLLKDLGLRWSVLFQEWRAQTAACQRSVQPSANLISIVNLRVIARRVPFSLGLPAACRGNPLASEFRGLCGMGDNPYLPCLQSPTHTGQLDLAPRISNRSFTRNWVTFRFEIHRCHYENLLT